MQSSEHQLDGASVANVWVDQADQAWSRRNATKVPDDLSLREVSDWLRRDVGRHDDLRVIPEQMVLRQRLAREDVEHRAAKLACVEAVEQVLLDEMAAPTQM